MRRLVLAAIVVVSSLSGCASAVTRYYTLSDVAGTAAPARTAEAALVGVGPVDIPDYVDIPNIVVRTGDNTLDQATFDQWGSSLDDMVPHVLVDNLQSRMPGDHFVAFPQSGDLPFDLRVPITISRFDVSSAGEAVVIARWQVRGKAGSITVHETTARATASGSGYSARVAALSKALGILTDDIAKALASLPREQPKAHGAKR